MKEYVVAQSEEGNPVDIVTLTQRVMSSQGIASERCEDWLEVREVGLVIEPRIVAYGGAGEGDVQTTSIIRIRHPEHFPDPIFEYQHATGDALEPSLQEGVENWLQLDFPALADATRVEPQDCATLKFGTTRRAVLGPAGRMALEASDDAGGEHTFCPCCMLTNSFDAFHTLIQSEAVFAIRLYAARTDQDGVLADCRVNGEDYEPGKAALLAYAETWGGSGFDSRKQYVILQRAPG
jgi:hypothetical protein